MAVVWAVETWSERKREISTQADIATRVFLVLCDQGSDGPDVAVYAAGIPRYGDVYPLADTLWCESTLAEPVDGHPMLFKVICAYTSQGATRPIGSPLWPAREAEIEWGAVTERGPVVWARAYAPDGSYTEGKYPGNSAGEVFNPPLERDWSRLALRITRNELAYSPVTAVAYADAINADTFWGCEPGSAKLAPIVARRQFESGVWFYAVTYEIHFRSRMHTAGDGWDQNPYDLGHYYRNDDGELVPVVDPDTREPTTVPQPLNGYGGQLPDGAEPFWLRFGVYPIMPFAILRINNTDFGLDGNGRRT